jgi:hypothetical protein
MNSGGYRCSPRLILRSYRAGRWGIQDQPATLAKISLPAADGYAANAANLREMESGKLYSFRFVTQQWCKTRRNPRPPSLSSSTLWRRLCQACSLSPFYSSRCRAARNSATGSSENCQNSSHRHAFARRLILAKFAAMKSAWSNKCAKRWRKQIRRCMAGASRFTDAVYVTLV